MSGNWSRTKPIKKNLSCQDQRVSTLKIHLWAHTHVSPLAFHWPLNTYIHCSRIYNSNFKSQQIHLQTPTPPWKPVSPAAFPDPVNWEFHCSSFSSQESSLLTPTSNKWRDLSVLHTHIHIHIHSCNYLLSNLYMPAMILDTWDTWRKKKQKSLHSTFLIG